MKNIISEHLTEFKVIYLKSVKKQMLDRWEYISNIKEIDFIIENGGKEDKGVYRHNKSTFAKWQKISNEKYYGFEPFKIKFMNNADLGFDKNINKAVDKIIKKGLDLDNLEFNYRGITVDGNVSMFITDGKKKVDLYTIIAEGEIQTAHYRFLVK